MWHRRFVDSVDLGVEIAANTVPIAVETRVGVQDDEIAKIIYVLSR